MRAIDNYTPQEIEILALKGMTGRNFDVRREHEHDLEEESRRDEEQNESEGQ